MAIDDDLSASLPKPPPPHPARREEAIDAALRRFDGAAEEAPAADRPRPMASPWWTRLRQPQMGVLVSAAVVAAIGLPVALIAIRDLSPRANQETVAPRPTQSGPATLPLAPPISAPDGSGALDVQRPQSPATEVPNSSPAAPERSAARDDLVSRPNNDGAAAQPASPFADYAGPPAPPPPPARPPPPEAQAEPIAQERSASEAATSDVMVTGSRSPGASFSRDRSSKASQRAPAGTAEQAAGGGAANPSYEAFLTRLQSAIRANDRRAVIKLIGFPLRVNSNRGTRLYPDARSVEREFDGIFTPAVRRAILRQQSNQLFVRDQGAMIGDGEVWFDHTCPNSACRPLGPVRIKAVNR